MITEKKLRAARANLLKRRPGFTPDGIRRLREAANRHKPWRYSTGPRTAAGKLRSRANAVRIGQWCRVVEPFASAHEVGRRLWNRAYLDAAYYLLFLQAKRADNSATMCGVCKRKRKLERQQKQHARRRLPAWERFAKALGVRVPPERIAVMTDMEWFELIHERTQSLPMPEGAAVYHLIDGFLAGLRPFFGLAGKWEGRWRIRKGRSMARDEVGALRQRRNTDSEASNRYPETYTISHLYTFKMLNGTVSDNLRTMTASPYSQPRTVRVSES